jgi:hypothetical protein
MWPMGLLLIKTISSWTGVYMAAHCQRATADYASFLSPSPVDQLIHNRSFSCMMERGMKRNQPWVSDDDDCKVQHESVHAEEFTTQN